MINISMNHNQKSTALPKSGESLSVTAELRSSQSNTINTQSKAPPDSSINQSKQQMKSLAQESVTVTLSQSPEPMKSPVYSKPKAETPKAETPKAETPKAETPKAETPKAETQKVEIQTVSLQHIQLGKTDIKKTDKTTAESTLSVQDLQPAQVSSFRESYSHEEPRVTLTSEQNIEQKNPEPPVDNPSASQYSVELSVAEKQQVAQLQQRQAEVRQHEQAHAAAGSSTTGQPKYEYTTGPDGNRYVVSGEVSVQYSASSDPSKQLEDAEKVQRAANAPAQPSAQDRAVAREARQKITQAKQAIIEQSQQPDQRRSLSASLADTSSVSVSPIKPDEIRKNGIESAQQLFDQQKKVMESLDSIRQESSRRTGGSNGVSASGFTLDRASSSPQKIGVQRSSDETKIELPIEFQSQIQPQVVMSDVSENVTLLRGNSQQENNITAEQHDDEEENERIKFDEHTIEIDRQVTEQTVERVAVLVNQEAQFQQGIVLADGQSNVYQKALQAINTRASQTQEPGSVFTALV